MRFQKPSQDQSSPLSLALQWIMKTFSFSLIPASTTNRNFLETRRLVNQIGYNCRSLPPFIQIQSLCLIPNSVADHLAWPHLPINPISNGTHRTSPDSLLHPSPQLQQLFPGNAQTTLAIQPVVLHCLSCLPNQIPQSYPYFYSIPSGTSLLCFHH